MFTNTGLSEDKSTMTLRNEPYVYAIQYPLNIALFLAMFIVLTNKLSTFSAPKDDGSKRATSLTSGVV